MRLKILAAVMAALMMVGAALPVFGHDTDPATPGHHYAPFGDDGYTWENCQTWIGSGETAWTPEDWKDGADDEVGDPDGDGPKENDDRERHPCFDITEPVPADPNVGRGGGPYGVYVDGKYHYCQTRISGDRDGGRYRDCQTRINGSMQDVSGSVIATTSPSGR